VLIDVYVVAVPVAEEFMLLFASAFDASPKFARCFLSLFFYYIC